ncbi:zinc-binding dehydrogenase [Pleurocapsales cyanobacterium LEGE 10410]|nr:zinc-binding dehydrogenase [Pleurocapsales cyanobacterium LEGE 10410]
MYTKFKIIKAIALALGADVTINYLQTPVKEFVAQYTDGCGFDLVFDTVGNDNLQNAFKAVKLNGTVISTVSLSQQDLTLLHAKGLTLHLVYMLIPLLTGSDRPYHGQILSKIANLVDEGQIRPLIDDRVFPLTEVAAAHTYLESGKAMGKIVLTS